MTEERQQLTRRNLLRGATTTTLGVVAVGGSKAGAEPAQWDKEVDIIVVGTGMGASTAALTASENGDSVLMLEKAPLFGGTSAKTAGVIWIPNNFTLRDKGIEDSKEDCLRYMARFSAPAQYNPNEPHLGLSESTYALLEAFYDHSYRVCDRLREWQALDWVEWRMFHLDRSATDYLDNVPENKVPTGRAMGVRNSNGQTSDGRELMEQMRAAVEKRKVPVLLNHRVVSIVRNETGRVLGVEAQTSGGVLRVGARKGVIFATGGYAHNTVALEHYQRGPLYGSCAMPASTGDFIELAGTVGASMGQLSGAWRCQVVLEVALARRQLAAGVFIPPGDSMLQVNRYGVRCVNENRNYNDRGEIHSVYDPTRAEFTNQLLFMIYDQRTAEAYAGIYPLPEQPDGAGYVLRAASLEELGAAIRARLGQLGDKTGHFDLDDGFEGNLRETVKRFNGFALAGVDEDFERGRTAYDTEWHQAFSPIRTDTDWPANPMPNMVMHPLRDEGPYYAIILGAGALDTNGGPRIDASGRVLDAAGEPIAGLYGAGNCVASASREAYFGAGHPLGFSMTYGFIAANHAHKNNQA